jgi:hypothetical protein
VGTRRIKDWLKHASRQCIINHLQVFLQYNGVSAWVPASFAVPTLLPKISLQSIKQLGKKKSKEQTDKEFRQVELLLCSLFALAAADEHLCMLSCVLLLCTAKQTAHSMSRLCQPRRNKASCNCRSSSVSRAAVAPARCSHSWGPAAAAKPAC